MIIIFILFILITYIVLVASCITKIIIIILFFLSYLLIFLFIFAAKRIKDKESVNWKIFFAYWRKTKIILFKIKLSVTRIGWNHDICSIVPLNAQFRYSSYTKLHFKMAVILNDMLVLISGLPRHIEYGVECERWNIHLESHLDLLSLAVDVLPRDVDK